MRDLNEVPARLLFDLLYCLVLDETRETVDRREELDRQLDSAGMGATPGRRLAAPDRSDRERRAATWGKAPTHQRAMRSAIAAGGTSAAVSRSTRVAGARGRG